MTAPKIPVVELDEQDEDWLVTLRKKREDSHTTKKAKTAFVHSSPAALEAYLKSHPKADRKKHTVKQKGDKSSPVQKPKEEASKSKAEAKPQKLDDKKPAAEGSTKRKTKTELSGCFKPATVDVDVVLEKHEAAFAAIDKKVTKQAKDFKSSIVQSDPWNADPKDLMGPHYENLSLAEKRLHVGGHLVGQIFEKGLTQVERDLHEKYMRNWTSSSTSWDFKGSDRPEDFDHSSQELQGLASAFGVSGYEAPTDNYTDRITNGGMSAARERAAKDPKLAQYAKKMYDYQQAYFKQAGIKELTLYRGVAGAPDNAETGQEISVESRELASFSADPNIAKRFGRPVKFRVPVERIFASSLVRPALGSETFPQSADEAEFIVLGASDLMGTAIGIPIDRRIEAATKEKKPIKVPITDENADWLHPRKKKSKPVKPKTKTSAVRVLTRFLAAKSCRSEVLHGPSGTPQRASELVVRSR